MAPRRGPSPATSSRWRRPVMATAMSAAAGSPPASASTPSATSATGCRKARRTPTPSSAGTARDADPRADLGLVLRPEPRHRDLLGAPERPLAGAFGLLSGEPAVAPGMAAPGVLRLLVPHRNCGGR